MPFENETWGEYSKLVLKELERLADNQEKMRQDIDEKFSDIREIISSFKTTEKSVTDLKEWVNRVNDVWSPSQMKEAKDELYKQKNKWVATIAVLAFVEIVIGVALVVWGNLTK